LNAAIVSAGVNVQCPARLTNHMLDLVERLDRTALDTSEPWL
jgi:hypothetical protein